MKPNTLVMPQMIRDRLVFQQLLADRDLVFEPASARVKVYPAITYGDYWAHTGRKSQGGRLERSAILANGVKLVASAGNTKMRCLTFSLPAGPPKLGGSCLGATTGFKIGLHPSQGLVPLTDKQDGFVCNICYGLGGAGMAPDPVLRQAVSMIWAKRALEQQTFVDQMKLAIKTERTRLTNMVVRAMARGETWKTSKLSHPDYMRIHDTGDFFSQPYFETWMRVIKAFPRVRFWAATRAWGSSWMQPISRLPTNFVLRPSAEFFGDDPPAIAGMHAGTIVYSDARGQDEGMCYACPATHSKTKNCQQAKGHFSPAPGVMEHHKTRIWASGCRACWDAPNTEIAYLEH